MKIGIFGGTFNPIHYGHLRAAEEVRERLGFDKILFVPSGDPPLKTEDLAHARHRYKMTRLAILTNRLFELSDIECGRAGKSYTVKTIEQLKTHNPEIEFTLILGIDAFLDLTNWWHPERLVAMTDFVIISRPDFKFSDLQASPYIKFSKTALKRLGDAGIETDVLKLKSNRVATLLRITRMEISSTGIRGLLKGGKSVKYLLPAEIESYIITNKLYVT